MAAQAVRAGRAVWAVAAGSFLVRAGFGLILPSLPAYLRAHHLPVPYLGLASAAYLALGIGGMFFLAPLSDRLGHVRALVAGGGVYAAGTLLLVVWPSGPALLAGRGLQGLAMGLYTPAAAAYLAGAVAPSRRGAAYGAVASAQMSGYILGPAAGGVALGLLGTNGPLLGAAAASVLTVAVSLLLPAAPAPAGIETAGVSDRRGLFGPLAALLAAPWGLAFVAFTIGQQVPSGVYDAVWSLYMFHLGAPPWLVGASYALWALPLVALAPLFGRWSNADRAARPMAIGGGVMAAAACAYALVPSPYAVTAIGLLEGVGSAAVVPLSQVYLAQRVPQSRLAAASGAAGALGQAAALVAAVLAGFAFSVRPWLPFGIAAAGLAWGTVTFVLRGRGAAAAAVTASGTPQASD